MVKRFTNSIATAAIAGALFIAGAVAAQAQDPLKVTMIAYPPGDEFSFTIENAARDQAQASNVDLTVQNLQSYELASQIAILNAVITTKPDAIIVSPVDPNGLQPALETAKARGIKIVLFDNVTRDLSVAATFVSADIVELGRNAGREFKRLAGEKRGGVFYQGSLPAVTFFESLHSGWEEVLESEQGYRQLPVTYSDFEPAKAASQMQAVLVSTPDLIGGFTGIILDQQGNIPAIERAGKLDGLVLIGVDGAPQNVERLKAGKLDAIVSVKARDYGVEVIKAAVAAIAGEKLPERTVIGQCLLTADNVAHPDNAGCLYDRDTR